MSYRYTIILLSSGSREISCCSRWEKEKKEKLITEIYSIHIFNRKCFGIQINILKYFNNHNGGLFFNFCDDLVIFPLWKHYAVLKIFENKDGHIDSLVPLLVKKTHYSRMWISLNASWLNFPWHSIKFKLTSYPVYKVLGSFSSEYSCYFDFKSMNISLQKYAF